MINGVRLSEVAILASNTRRVPSQALRFYVAVCVLLVVMVCGHSKGPFPDKKSLEWRSRLSAAWHVDDTA